MMVESDTQHREHIHNIFREQAYLLRPLILPHLRFFLFYFQNSSIVLLFTQTLFFYFKFQHIHFFGHKLQSNSYRINFFLYFV